MENYEEKYNQALERARKSYNKAIEEGWTCDKCIYEEIFPELKESEDERIKKELISFFTKRDEFSKSEPFDELSNKQIIAWLEKQGEQKTAWSEEDEKILKELVEEVKDQLDSAPSPDCIDKEDEKVLKQLNKWMDWLKSIKDRVQPHPKQEWSEEDEKFVVDTMNFLYRAKNQYAQTARLEECIDWLKSLKPH